MLVLATNTENTEVLKQSPNFKKKSRTNLKRSNMLNASSAIAIAKASKEDL